MERSPARGQFFEVDDSSDDGEAEAQAQGEKEGTDGDSCDEGDQSPGLARKVSWLLFYFVNFLVRLCFSVCFCGSCCFFPVFVFPSSPFDVTRPSARHRDKYFMLFFVC